jgi:dolichol-phosphate mannosyltransferase
LTAAAPLAVPSSRPKVLCVAPAWNEGERIGTAVRSVPSDAVDLVVVCDDGSRDATPEIATRAGAHVLRGERNVGVGASIRRGIDYARAHGYDVVVVISGAGKTPAEQIPQLLEPILDGRADFAQGSRYTAGGSHYRMPWRRVAGTRAYSWLFSLLVGRRVTDASSGFRAFRLSIFDDRRIDLWQDWLDRYELEPYLLFQSLRHGVRLVEIPVRIEYPPSDGIPYTKMKALSGWWSIFRPVLFLALRIKR